MDFEKLFNEHGKWSNSTFGTDRPHTASIHHLKKEVDELLNAPLDDSEYADCLLLLMDAFRRKGGNAQQLIDVSADKLEVNKARKWGTPSKQGYVEHLRE